MARLWWAVLVCAGALVAQDTQSQTDKTQLKTRDSKSATKSDSQAGGKSDGAAKSGDQQYAAPVEEDEDSKPAREYVFNPVQATRELRIGNFYFKKGNYRAAILRFQEAAKWNPGLAEAYLRMGEAAEKSGDAASEKEAFSKYLDVSPDAKDAGEIKKKLAKLK